MNEQEDPKAVARQRVILEVLANRVTVTEAALELGVSRKTYYEWQERGLSAMRQALQDRPGGRPPQPVDPEKQALLEEMGQLRKDRLVLESRLLIQQAVRQTLAAKADEPSPDKKKREARAHDRGRPQRTA